MKCYITRKIKKKKNMYLAVTPIRHRAIHPSTTVCTDVTVNKNRAGIHTYTTSRLRNPQYSRFTCLALRQGEYPRFCHKGPLLFGVLKITVHESKQTEQDEKILTELTRPTRLGSPLSQERGSKKATPLYRRTLQIMTIQG